MNEKSKLLIERTHKFSIAVLKLCDDLPKGRSTGVITRQLLRCGSSVGANYRAACRGKSKADFIAKLGIVHEEIDESIYWFNMLIETKAITIDKGEAAIKEAKEILAMVVASLKTAKSSQKR